MNHEENNPTSQICFGFPVQAFHYGVLRNACPNEKNIRGFLNLRGPGDELRQQTKEVWVLSPSKLLSPKLERLVRV
ncbi:hypothetical protein CDAR_409861 [Caerostris darwini]|uniref:Uncharacterized protein n=1 Tax=Caerostris darwini TaxID=1538125 RepID=A0AAV4SC12_9ARAC|nr:hypothetical protein CDAR_409861 [Caerostris darwini]